MNMSPELQAEIETIEAMHKLPVGRAKRVLEMMAMQHDLNVLTAGPDWMTKGLPWRRAMMQEACELQGHIGWKWWKKQEPDILQAHIELVDIYHFLLSSIIEACNGNMVEAIRVYAISSDGNLDSEVFPPASNQITLRSRDPMQRIDGFIGLAAFSITYVFVFDQMCADLHLTFDELRRMYVAKNVLNIFRQNNGYKDGTYTKVWAGAEDNVHLARIMEYNPQASVGSIMEELQRVYTTYVLPQPGSVQ
jgi:hypothetical protein